MAGTEFNTWIGDTANGINPYRPAESDFGGADKTNDAGFPPEPGDPEASEWNQLVMQSAGMALMAPAAFIDVRFSGGTPSVFAVYSPNNDLEIADVTVTDVGTGIVTLAILATKLPDVRFGAGFPQATGNHTVVAYRSTTQTLRCEVRTAGVAADVNFVAVWY